MATAKTAAAGDRQPSQWKRNVIVLALVLAVAATVWIGNHMRGEARARAAFAAQAGCQCRYVTGLPLATCAADPGVQQGWVELSADEAAHAVSAGVPMLAEQTARWSQESGCMLDPWQE